MRRLWLLDEKGRGLGVTAAGKLSASALHYTTRQLDEAWRLDELKPIRETVLSLDFAQQGLGNGSCAQPITLEKYQLKPSERYEFGFSLQPARSESMNSRRCKIRNHHGRSRSGRCPDGSDPGGSGGRGPVVTVNPVPFSDVRLDAGLWAERIGVSRDVTIPHSLRQCEETGRIDNFAVAAGLKEGRHELHCMGITELYRETGDPELLAAAKRLWESTTHRKLYVTGGIGAIGNGESFGNDYQLPNATAYAETCAGIGLAFFAHLLWQIDPDAEYIDVLERAIYNEVLGGVQISGDRFFYPNKLHHVGVRESVEQRFPEPAAVSSIGVYWLDEGDTGPCRVPKSSPECG